MDEKEKLFKKIFACVRIVVYASIAYIIYELMSNSTTFNCYINDKFGILCPACGATRATLSIITGKFINALKYNLVYTVSIFPLFTILIVDDIYLLVIAIFKKKKKTSLLEVFFEMGENKSE